MTGEWYHKIFEISTPDVEPLALELFRFQYEHSAIYRQFVDALAIDPGLVKKFTAIPFLPISLFKTAKVTTTLFEPQVIFESSGTTGLTASRHFVRDEGLYRQSFTRHFESQYGPVKDWCIIGLLPGYLERKHSSLVHMVNTLVTDSGHPQSGFYLHDHAQLASVLAGLEAQGQKTLLIGVSFALLDFAEHYPMPLRHTIIMETGGMKGRRKELLREELHDRLRKAFQLDQVHAEYGMTELLSQAYSQSQGIFRCPPWMRVLVRDDEDPLHISMSGAGALNIIDLANVFSCCFIATEDVGRVHPGGQFEVLGRMDGSDLRGCSLMVS
jgi:phenylacetate-coenzyme A ligase PaaK-like adenylate-forming protein